MSNNVMSPQASIIYGRNLSLLWAFPTALEQVRSVHIFLCICVYMPSPKGVRGEIITHLSIKFLQS